MDWNTIIASLGLSTVTVTSVILFGGKTLVNRWAERGKIKLQKKLDEQLETHKADLIRTTNDLQERLRIEYGSLYKERLEAIKSIYEKLYAIDCFLKKYRGLPDHNPNILQEELEGIERYLGSIDICIRNLDKEVGNALIYFSENDAVQLNHVVEELNKLLQAIINWQANVDEGYYEGKSINKSVEDMKNANIPQAIDSVRRLFRQLIGVQTGKNVN
ncbi:MAG TPA: hypothetical protein K8V55_01365 [Alistipes finegoldii]|uniref:hypothetical protein n=1 Tax=Alistipes finegoldii TaxID=214856 RepID=UPI001DC54559|nr:hypothetical protein [Alistipes finegoldii]HJG72156.1 hypothetical protein [Alistipes finegoldii]